MIGIYCIENIINHKKYIGQSKQIEIRIKRHFRELRQGKHHCVHLQRAFDKYGEDCFTWHVIQECTEFDDLDELERYYIKEFDSFSSGYNSTQGGGGDLGMIVTDEFRDKMRKLSLGENNPNYGHAWTDDMKKHLSDLFSDGSRKGANNARAIKVIRVEDAKVFDYLGEAAHSCGLASGSSLTRCLKNKNNMAAGYHWAPYSDENLSFFSDERNVFKYLFDCYKSSNTIMVADEKNCKFYSLGKFVKYINTTTNLTTQEIENIYKTNKTFVINDILYQLTVA